MNLDGGILRQNLTEESARVMLFMKKAILRAYAPLPPFMDADELAAEAFSRAWLNSDRCGTGPEIDRALGWLRAVARNYACQCLREETKRRRMVLEPHEAHTSLFDLPAPWDISRRPVDIVVEIEGMRAILKAVENLSQRDRDLIAMTSHGVKRVEIAQRLGMTFENVKKRVMRLRKRMKALLR